MEKKLFGMFLMLVSLLCVFSSCSNNAEEAPADTTPEQLPSGPNYEAMDSRSVEAILAFDEPFMNETLNYWDDYDMKNAAVSPLSAACVVAMIANGADEEGQNVAMKAFGMNGSDLETLNTTISDIVTSIVHKTSISKLDITNSAWAHKASDYTVTFDKQYIEILKKYFNAEVAQADLHTEMSNTFDHPLNKWASDVIGEEYRFFKPYSSCRIVLANILNFEADWKEQFKNEDTTPEKFNNIDGTTVDTEFLVGSQHVTYAECELGEYIEMKYKNENISFKIFVPEKGRFGEADFSVFNPKKVRYEWRHGKTVMHMPKFDLNVKNELRDVLLRLGMGKLLAGNDNPFSSMASVSDPSVDLGNFLKFDQDIFVSVNEKGAKAVVITSASNGLIDDLDTAPDVIVVDRPYLFEIVAYGQTIVAGRIVNF